MATIQAMAHVHALLQVPQHVLQALGTVFGLSVLPQPGFGHETEKIADGHVVARLGMDLLAGDGARLERGRVGEGQGLVAVEERPEVGRDLRQDDASDLGEFVCVGEGGEF